FAIDLPCCDSFLPDHLSEPAFKTHPFLVPKAGMLEGCVLVLPPQAVGSRGKRANALRSFFELRVLHFPATATLVSVT
ncbi:MAG: hypothetical protein Q4P23_03655, partial [Micrococcaceae bacterium]|nr:hypothetical protein [Micrococcaceae bacterium]